jgi:hypothetical protein
MRETVALLAHKSREAAALRRGIHARNASLEHFGYRENSYRALAASPQPRRTTTVQALTAMPLNQPPPTGVTTCISARIDEASRFIFEVRFVEASNDSHAPYAVSFHVNCFIAVEYATFYNPTFSLLIV